jgi:hypothetical protein
MVLPFPRADLSIKAYYQDWRKPLPMLRADPLGLPLHGEFRTWFEGTRSCKPEPTGCYDRFGVLPVQVLPFAGFHAGIHSPRSQSKQHCPSSDKLRGTNFRVRECWGRQAVSYSPNFMEVSGTLLRVWSPGITCHSASKWKICRKITEDMGLDQYPAWHSCPDLLRRRANP